MPQFVNILAGDPAPGFTQASAANPRYSFDTAAGRYLVMCFFHTAASRGAARALAAVKARGDLFDDEFASFFGVSTDPEDAALARVANSVPGYRFIWDFDRSVSKRYGASPIDADGPARPIWVVTDPTLRVVDVIAFMQDGSDVARVLGLLGALPPPDRFAGIPLQAPVLFLPRVFEADLCERLIATYEAAGGEMSGFMREVDGKTIGMHDLSHKSRRDVLLQDPDLIARVQARIVRRIVPEIAKVHHFHATRMERYLIGCYAAEEGGHFAPHLDNTTAGTAHRRFAVSVNLNDAFEGGEVSFPEYGPRGFKAPAGGAVVFSCALLHKVGPVTGGRRFAFLPFLYDDAAAALRDANRHLVQPADR